MGADYSKGKRHRDAAKYGQIYLQTDKSTYYGGDTVTGNIYLNILTPYPGKQLFLKLKGKEGVHLVQQRAETYYETVNGNKEQKTRYVDELYEENYPIIKMLVPIHSWETLMPGQFVIPFAFMLPNNLPNSFFQEGYKYLAHISYQLEAVLEPAISNDPKLKYKQAMVVRQPIKSAIQNYKNEIITNIKSCICCGQGSNKLKVNFERNWYAPGETAQVMVQLDNSQCQITNKNITFSLKQKLRVAARGRIHDRNFYKVTRTITGIRAGGQSDNSLIAVNLPSFQGGDYRKVKTFSMKSYLMTLKENLEVLYPTTRSKLITSEYYLEVSCPMEGCCTSTPGIDCPVEIYYPDIQFVPVSAPGNWAPETYDVANVSFAASQGAQNEVSINTDASLMQNQMMGNNYQPPGQYGQQGGQQYGNNYYK